MKQLLCAAVAATLLSGIAGAQEAPKAAPQPEMIKEEAAEAPFTFQAAMDIYSAYVWRGYVLNDRPVWQPSVSGILNLQEAGKVTAEIWSNFDMTERNHHHTGLGLNEIDYTLDYSVDLRGLELCAGHSWYTYPKADGNDYGNSQREIYTGIAYPNELITPSAKLYYDYSDSEGVYAELGLNKEVKLNDRLAIGGDAILGLGDDDYIVYNCGDHADGGWNDVTFDIYATYAVCDHFTVGAKLAWTSLLGDASRDNEPYYDEDILWGGVNLNVSF